MKFFTKRKVFAAAAIVSVLAILSTGSLAWFSDSDAVENDFYIADSTDTADDIFSVDLFEWVDADKDGVIDEGEKDQDGLQFGKDGEGNANQEVIPGATLDKKAFVENTGKYDQYVRVKVTATKVSTWIKALGYETLQAAQTAGVDLSTIFIMPENFDANWHRLDSDTVVDATADKITYVYYYNGILEPEKSAQFMKAFKVPTGLTREQAAEMGGAFDIDLVAEAIQSEAILASKDTVEWKNAAASFAAVAPTEAP